MNGELLCADLPEQGLGLEARTAAGRAGRVGAVAGEQHADVHAVALRLQPREETLRPEPHPVVPLPFAVDDPFLLRGGELTPRNVGGHALAPRVLHELGLHFAEALRLPRLHGATGEGLRVIRDDERPVNADGPAEPAAGRAGADGRVEREEVRRRVRVVDVAECAVQVGGEVQRLGGGFLRCAACGCTARAAPGGSQDVRAHAALAVLQRGLQVLHDARAVGAPADDPVLDHLELPPVLPVDPRVALLCQEILHLVPGEVLRHRDGEGEQEPAARRELVDDGLGRVAPHGPAAAAAVQRGSPGEEQLQVIVELRHRSHGGARCAHRVGLVDGDRGRDPLDAVHARLVHAVEELAGIRGEGFHVAALTFRVDGVERQRGLPRPAHSRHHDELSQGNGDVQVAQVVLPRAFDDDATRGTRLDCRTGNGRLLPAGHRGAKYTEPRRYWQRARQPATAVRAALSFPPGRSLLLVF